jgi:hypothetical protein
MLLQDCQQDYLNFKLQKEQEETARALKMREAVISHANDVVIPALVTSIRSHAREGRPAYDNTWSIHDDMWEKYSLNPDYIQVFCHHIEQYFQAEGIVVDFDEDGENGIEYIHLLFRGWA